MRHISKMTVALLLTGSSLPALAQTAETAAPDQTSAAATSSDDVELEEIVVTANKRVENINKVGLTITAISPETLVNRRISSLEDIARAVPGLDVAPSFAGTPI